MRMKTHHLLSAAALLLGVLACNSGAKEAPATTAGAPPAVTNELFRLAPAEYAEKAEASVQALARADFDAWGATLADDVAYAFPDGDPNTRTTLKGKTAVLDWWKKFRATPGVESMAVSEFNLMPIEVTGEAKGGAPKGIYVIAYFTNVLGIKGQSVGLRMNFSIHFNADQKIDRLYGYYDRTPIVRALGQNLLEAQQTK